MSDGFDIPAVVMAFAALTTALGAFVLNYLKGHAAEKAADRAALAADAALIAAADAKAEIIKVGDKVYELGKAVDGRLSKLLALTEAAALAQGRVEGAVTEKARADLARNDPRTGSA